MAKELTDGGRVEIRGLCSFFVKEYGSYTGRNPKTGE
ncbi:MAG: integration host factor subunit beta, partial [Chloroflexi bacterium]|nr:integration host factor subunit beta [Chloroflexota bacterium]